MRGYRGPHVLDEPETYSGFEDQFEHDSYGLTFRKFGRGRPVRVTSEERDDVVERFDRSNAIVGQAAMAAVIAWAIGIFWLSDGDSGPGTLAFLGIAAIGGAGWVARRCVWNRTVSRFARRTPAGPDRTLIDQYRLRAVSMSWAEIVLASIGSSFFLALLASAGRGSDFFEAIMAGIVLATAVALGVLKLFTRRV